MALRERLELLAVRLLAAAGRDRERGQGMVEYAMILVMVGLALLLIVSVIGKQTLNMYSNISNGLDGH